jgi:hypothetical protein
MLFLIDYDRRKGQIVKMERYDDSERNRANEERLSLEINHIRSGVEREVVILEAASEASMRNTHRRYFENWETLARNEAQIDPRDRLARKQQRSVDIDRGLFLIRYATAEDNTNPPVIGVSLDPRSDTNSAMLILPPDDDRPILSQPGSSMVVRALERCTLLIESTPSRENGSTAASIRIEPLLQGQNDTDNLNVDPRASAGITLMMTA